MENNLVNSNMCQVQGHTNQTWFGICIGQKCGINKRFGCMKCIKQNHKNCSIKEIIDLNELEEDGFSFYPKWVQQIQDFCDLEIVRQIQEDQFLKHLENQFEQLKDIIIEEISQNKKRILLQFKEKSNNFQQLTKINEEYKQFNLKEEIQQIIKDPLNQEQKLQEQIQMFAEKYQQSHEIDKIDLQSQYLLGNFKSSQVEIQSVQEFINDLKKRFDQIKSNMVKNIQMIDLGKISQSLGLNFLEKREEILIYQQLEKKYKSNFYFQKIFDTQEDGFLVEDFHKKCDLKQNILIFIESKDQDRFGGFTSLKFDKNDNSTTKGGFNFLFNLNTLKIFTQNNQKKSIQNNSSNGPIFGENDLWIYDQSNEKKDSNSRLGQAYGKNEEASERDLTKNHKFYIERYQVFQMKL